jgi:hypothetical protein
MNPGRPARHLNRREDIGMLSGLVAALLMVGLASGPLLWRVRQDRREARAESILADANAALFRTFGGESLVAVHVRAPSLWRPGRVELSAPADWHALLTPAWESVGALVPEGYELVVKPAAPAPSPLVSENAILHRAA